MQYLGEITALFEGKQQPFYLFKVSYDTGEEPAEESWLRVCGPFSTDKKSYKQL